MAHNELTDLGLALARGDAAVWVGSEWMPPAAPDDLERLTRVSWLGVWSEAQDVEFAAALSRQMREQGDRRLLVEVPNRIDDALAEYYKLAEVCPYFYLNGRAGGGETLSQRQRVRSRGDKIAELKRLGPAVLVVVGYQTAAPLAQLLGEEITEDAPDLRVVFVAGMEPEELERLRSALPNAWADRLRGEALELLPLLRAIESRRHRQAEGPALRIGSNLVPLQSLLRTEPPIDQDYLLLTVDVVRDPEPEEDSAQLLRDLLAGREPWRALAHNLAWQRPNTHTHREKVRQSLQRFRFSDRRVQVLEIPAETGSGLTLLLQQIGFEAALAGHPTLIHRPRDEPFDYNAIRRFLTDLYQATEIARSDLDVPAVLIFDAPSVEADALQHLYDLPERLSRDDRRVLMIRALPVRGSADNRPHPSHGPRSSPTRVERLDTLRTVITPAEQESLAGWALSRGAFSASAVDSIRNWDRTPHSLPLMIALYYILTEDLRSAAGFGRHLLNGFRRLLPAETVPEGLAASDGVLSGEQLRAAVRALEIGLGRGAAQTLPPTRDELAAVFSTLAVLGCLRLEVSRSLLADMAGVARERAYAVVALLERADLVTTGLPFETSAEVERVDRPRAPVAYYTAREAVGLRHPAYGRLALEWLTSPNGLEDRDAVARDGLTHQILDRMSADGHLDEYPLSLLEPLLARLDKPRNPDHVRFVAYLALRYLRLPKKHETRRSGLAAWQWQHVGLLLDVLSWLNPQVVRASAITLHSRGITRYKDARRREDYEEAERDFLTAIDLARRTQQEHPGNIITSLGLLYRGWARWEREQREHGSPDRFREIDRKTEQTLREALRERPDNSFAAFGLASYLVDCYMEPDRGIEDEQRARALAEAIELLQLKPEANFADEWEELYGRAGGLLCDEDAERLINSLIEQGDEFGCALKALRCLKGYIPTEPTEEPSELRQIREAAEVLRQGEQGGPVKPSPLADLLRYVVFSADGEERKQHPAFQARFELLQRLVGTIYLERPLWLYDYAALAFQVGQYQHAANAFARLRRGQRFFEVSKDRSQFWTHSPDSHAARPVLLRVISAGQGDERGWGRIDNPAGYREPVPFLVRAFTSRGKTTRPGAVVRCYIRLNPAGPYAEPDAR